MVDLVLLRHGIAEERIGGRDHPDRALTVRGQQRTAAVVRALAGRGMRVDLLLTSPYQRALQTARLAVDAGLAGMLQIDPALQPGGDPFPLLCRHEGSLCLVGHEPDLSGLAARLLGMAPGAIALKKAGVLHLRLQGGSWQLMALLRPAVLLDPAPAVNSSSA